jgi:hypothetical protein
MTQREDSWLSAPSFAVSPNHGRTCPGRQSGCRPSAWRALLSALALSPSLAFGVAHGNKPDSLAFLWRCDAASRKIGGPHGIALCLQVITNSGEPFKSTASRNLLSKDR